MQPTETQRAMDACPFPYCFGKVSEDHCDHCERRAVLCEYCTNSGVWNRPDARFCRRCKKGLPQDRGLAWPMHGGNAARNFFTSDISIMPDFHAGQMVALEGFGISGATWGEIAHPVLVGQGLVVPHVAAKGFALFPRPYRTVALTDFGNRYSGATRNEALEGRDESAQGTDPGQQERRAQNEEAPPSPEWVAEFGFEPGVESTPVAIGASLYLAFSQEKDGRIHIARLPLDTGIPEFLEMEAGTLSPGQTPVGSVHVPEEGVVVWPACDRLLVARLRGPSLGISGQIDRRVAVLPAKGLEADDYLLSPVIVGGTVYALSSHGALFAFDWRKSLEAIRAQGLVALRLRPGSDRYAAPVVLGESLAWLKSHRANELSVETYHSGHGIRSTALSADGIPELAGDQDWGRHTLLTDGYNTLIVPSIQRSGCFEVRVEAGEPVVTWRGLRWIPKLRGVAACRAVTVLVEDTQIHAVPSLWELWNAPELQPALHKFGRARPLGAPVLGAWGLYVLTNEGLLAVPAAAKY